MKYKVCASRGCGLLVKFPAIYCDGCQPIVDKLRDNRKRQSLLEIARQRVYSRKAWKVTRRVVFERDGYCCVLCGATELEQPLVCDHYPVSVLECANPFDPDGCRTLCRRCSGVEDGKRATRGTDRTSE